MNIEADLYGKQRRFLWAQVLSEIPSDEDVPKDQPKTPPPVLTPKNFDELYRARKDLQANRVALPRRPGMLRAYQDFLVAHKKAQLRYGIDLITMTIADRVKQSGVIIEENDFPTNIAADTSHRLVWYRNDIKREQLAWLLAGLFLLFDVGKKDFVIFTNPTFNKSVPEILHHHLYIRHKGGFFKPSVNLAQILYEEDDVH